MKIEDKTLVILQYQLQTKNEEGNLELWEETSPEQPLRFVQGMDMMLPAFERNLAGLTEGDTFEFMIPVADAYGEYSEDDVIDLPKNLFLINGKFDGTKIMAGAIVPLVDSEGNRLNAEVVEVKENEVRVDLNHPLAGEDLYFSGRIISVTKPSDEELNDLLHPHHCHGCGGDCSDDCCSSCHGCHD